MDHQDKIAALDKAIEDCISTVRQSQGDSKAQDLNQDDEFQLNWLAEYKSSSDRRVGMMEKVFEWRDEIVKTETFKRLEDCEGPEFIVFRGQFGHVVPDSDTGFDQEEMDVDRPYYIKTRKACRGVRCDSLVIIFYEGSLRYHCFDGYGSWSVELTDARMAADFLTNDFIEALYAQIFSGAVYDVMKKEIEHYQEAIISVEEMKKEGYLDHIF